MISFKFYHRFLVITFGIISFGTLVAQKSKKFEPIKIIDQGCFNI